MRPYFSFPLKVELFQISLLGEKLRDVVSRETHSCVGMEGTARVFRMLVILREVPQACIAEGLFLSTGDSVKRES